MYYAALLQFLVETVRIFFYTCCAQCSQLSESYLHNPNMHPACHTYAPSTAPGAPAGAWIRRCRQACVTPPMKHHRCPTFSHVANTIDRGHAPWAQWCLRRNDATKRHTNIFSPKSKPRQTSHPRSNAHIHDNNLGTT